MMAIRHRPGFVRSAALAQSGSGPQHGGSIGNTCHARDNYQVDRCAPVACSPHAVLVLAAPPLAQAPRVVRAHHTLLMHGAALAQQTAAISDGTKNI